MSPSTFRPPTHHKRPAARSWSFWFILLVLVGPVWTIAPAAWVWVGWEILGAARSTNTGAHSRTWPWLRVVGLIWASLEIIFSIYYFYLARAIQPLSLPKAADPSLFIRILMTGLCDPETDPAEDDAASIAEDVEIDDLIEEMVNLDGVSIEKLDANDERAVTFRERLRTWFYHAEWSELGKDNVLDWVSWTNFGLPLEEALTDPARATVLEHAIQLIEARTGVLLPLGRNPKIRVIRLTLDKVHVRHRPLILYTLTGLINLAVEFLIYRPAGARRVSFGDIDYLVRIPPGWTPEIGRTDPKGAPIIYIHGLGFGFVQNHLVIQALLKTYSSHPVLIPIQPHISMTMFHPGHLCPADRASTVASLAAACEQYGFSAPRPLKWSGSSSPSTTPLPASPTTPNDSSYETKTSSRPARAKRTQTVILSHSNGSTIHAWLMKDRPDLAARSCFVDPVCFCLWEGDVAYNFVYRHPSTAIELLMSYFIGSEVGIANTISRNFDWSSNTLLFDEIRRGRDASRTAFFLGGKDAIIDAHRVRSYLERHGVTDGIHFEPNGSHGEAIIQGKQLDDVFKWIAGEESSGGGEAL